MEVTLNLSAPEHHDTSHMPRALRNLFYYKDDLCRAIDLYGRPNTGGQHRCTVVGKRADVVAWLDLFLEEFPDTKPEIDTVKRHIRQSFIRNPDGKTLHVTLADFTRQHVYQGGFISAPWFWVPEDGIEFPGQ